MEAHHQQETGGSLGFSTQRVGEATPGGEGRREEGDRARERGEGREESQLHSCREGITRVEGRCSICHES